ncbi:hypothetical protein NQZ79_g6566 [Umbelopsis isabellina]|nr:hypothetical protein NQZ79_g6566 [Umbelopsis isabellina]
MLSLPYEILYQILDSSDINDVWTVSQDSTLTALSASLIRSMRRAHSRTIIEHNKPFINLTPKLVHYIQYGGQFEEETNRAAAIINIFVQHIVITHHGLSLSWYLQRQLARLHEQYPIATLLQMSLTAATSQCQYQLMAIPSITTFLITNATTCPEIPLSDSFIFNIFGALDSIILSTDYAKHRKILIDAMGRVVFEMPIRGPLGRQMRQRYESLNNQVNPAVPLLHT